MCSIHNRLSIQPSGRRRQNASIGYKDVRGGNAIRYEFYEKPCASGLVIPANSAHSKQMKLSVMVEEGMRMLRNNSRVLDWESRRRVMEAWSRKLQRSGYPATFRHQVVSAAVLKWERMCKDRA